MNENLSITPLLKDWDFDPARVTARYIEAEIPEEAPEVQLRLDLGILQMKLDGRPDGSRPHGADSALKHYRQLVLTGRRSGFRLDSDACAELQQECVQVYYRYLSLMVLKDYERVIRDTQHSLEIMELVERYTDNEEVVWDFMQFKPYVIMMKTRALAEQKAADAKMEEAIAEIEAGMNEIEIFLVKVEEEPEAMNDCPELGMLEELITEIRERDGKDNPVVALKLKMQHAVRMENYEEAARLRDSIRQFETEAPHETLA